MPNPKRKHTRSRRDSRRSANWKLDKTAMAPCSNAECGRLRPPHVVCPHCGFYKGKQVLVPKSKKGSAEGGEQSGQ